MLSFKWFVFFICFLISSASLATHQQLKDEPMVQVELSMFMKTKTFNNCYCSIDDNSFVHGIMV